MNSDAATGNLPQLATTSNLPSFTAIPNNPLFSNTSIPGAASENKHIPTPSTIGVVFEGASKPGTIQKKRRGKKIGVGALDQQEAISTASEPYNATISTTSHQHQEKPSVSSQEDEAEKIRTAAAVAAERAEQFILQKQKEICREVHTNTFSSDSSSILHTGRYGASKENKNEVVPLDSTVEAAERAAKEAQHRMVNGSGNNTNTKNGIMSGFFGRTSKKFGFHLGNTSIHGKGTVGNTQNDGNHSGSNTPPRQNPSDSGIISSDSYKPNPSESIQAPPDPPASSHLTTPTRNGSSLSFIIPATTLSISSGVPNAVHDGTKRDETIDQATMQQRLEEERRAQFKEQERLWQAAQKEREEYERLAREREEERLRKLAEEERQKNRSPQEKMDELLAAFSSETQQAMKVVAEVRFLHIKSPEVHSSLCNHCTTSCYLLQYLKSYYFS